MNVNEGWLPIIIFIGGAILLLLLAAPATWVIATWWRYWMG